MKFFKLFENLVWQFCKGLWVKENENGIVEQKVNLKTLNCK